MDIRELIERKKHGLTLTREDIFSFIDALSQADDSQISAFLMAVYFKGMTSDETYYLTKAMQHSGETIDTSFAGGMVVDKHSTGGVSDTVTLVAVPVLAEAGLKVVKLSGRGLSHTGGTIDKLESIPGFKTELSIDEIQTSVKESGAVICSQSANLAPADKKLYALRDFTATVDSIPLIASSIMSKKLAAGSDIILLDVKYGSGAFMKTAQEAVTLARVMVDIAIKDGKKCAALVTSMEQPLTAYVGCNLELNSAIDVLNGAKNNLYEVSKEICSNIFLLANLEGTIEEAKVKFDKIIDSGAGIRRFEKIISAQKGDPQVLYDKKLVPNAHHKISVTCIQSGYIKSIDAEKIGSAVLALGGGREVLGGDIDHKAGLILKIKINQKVDKGDEIAVLYSSDDKKLAKAKKLVEACYQTSPNITKQGKLIYALITNDNTFYY